jgi:hypothetical protein
LESFVSEGSSGEAAATAALFQERERERAGMVRRCVCCGTNKKRTVVERTNKDKDKLKSTKTQLTGLFKFFFFLAWIFKRLAFLASITLRLTAKVRLESVQMRGARAVTEFVTPLLPTLNCVNCLVSLATEEDNIVPGTVYLRYYRDET